MLKISRKNSLDLYGITVGDSVRLGDTDLWARVEKRLIIIWWRICIWWW